MSAGRCVEPAKLLRMLRPSSRTLDVLVPLCGVVVGALVVVAVVRWDSTSSDLTNTVLVYGDGAVLAEPDFSAGVTQGIGAEVVLRSQPETAICDHLVQMRGDAHRLRPAVVVLAFAGSGRSECVRGSEGSALAQRYVADARTAINELTAGSSHVLLVGVPETAVDGYLQGLAAEWATATDRRGSVSYAAPADAVNAVTQALEASR